MSSTVDEAWEHTSCWMCKHLIYDMDTKQYKCVLLSKMFDRKYDVYKPTDCESYSRG